MRNRYFSSISTFSFAKFKERKSCEPRGRDFVQEQIYEHIFAQNRGHCVSYPSNILQRTFGYLISEIAKNREI